MNYPETLYPKGWNVQEASIKRGDLRRLEGEMNALATMPMDMKGHIRGIIHALKFFGLYVVEWKGEDGRTKYEIRRCN